VKQCAHCPWKKRTVPERDIPGGYSEEAHRALEGTIATPGAVGPLSSPTMRIMACHESPPGAERECVGWVLNQLGPGNNLALRMRARDGRYKKFRTVGPQHERFEDTLPKGTR